MIRKPVVAGQFYENDPINLKKQIKSCFESKFGPGSLPKKERKKDTIGIISPHAGYIFSGHGTAWAFKEIAESKLPDTYILLGLSHSGYPNSISLADWETPLGVIKNDTELAESIIKNSGIENNEEAHQTEHSIEVQLPFLQFINEDHLKELKIVPIIASHNFKELAQNIVKTIKKTNKKIIFIASSDFTHYGLNYGYFPFHEHIKENMYKLDKNAINYIESLSSDKFLNYIDKTGATICGKIPIACLLEISKLLGAKKASLLKYYTSGDIINDYSNAVGYAAIKI